MALTGDKITELQIRDVAAKRSYNTGKLMANRPGRRDRLLRPVVPLVDMNIRAADRGLLDTDQDVVDPDLGDRDVDQGEAGSGLCFYNCFLGFWSFLLTILIR